MDAKVVGARPWVTLALAPLHKTLWQNNDKSLLASLATTTNCSYRR